MTVVPIGGDIVSRLILRLSRYRYSRGLRVAIMGQPPVRGGRGPPTPSKVVSANTVPKLGRQISCHKKSFFRVQIQCQKIVAK